MESCEGCGFEWDAVTAAEVPPRLQAAAAGFRTVLAGDAVALASHRDDTTWSPVEYGAHVRDVLLNLRDRIVLGLAQDNPVPHAMFGDLRIRSGLYAADRPDQLTADIDVAAGLFVRTIAALDDEQLARPIFYGWPTAATRTLLWVAAQALHEAEHHLTDVQALSVAS